MPFSSSSAWFWMLASISFLEAACCGQQIRDGSFETTSGYSWLTGPTTFGAWNIDRGFAAVVNNGFGPAHSGQQILVMPMVGTASVASVSQTIEGFVPGQRYHLTFHTRSYHSPVFSNSVAARVSLGSGTLVFDSPPSNSTTQWVRRQIDFVASQQALRLQIIASHPDFGGYICFDDFALPAVTNFAGMAARRDNPPSAVGTPGVITPAVNQAAVPADLPSHTMVVFPALEICWGSRVGTTYQVQWAPTLDNAKWENLGSATRAVEASTCVFDSTRHSGARFYRVVSLDR